MPKPSVPNQDEIACAEVQNVETKATTPHTSVATARMFSTGCGRPSGLSVSLNRSLSAG
ncbi:hypothetical protein ACFQ0B_11575 [Nonomuraea thailandensis]